VKPADESEAKIIAGWDCPRCGAAAGEPCARIENHPRPDRRPIRKVHLERRRAWYRSPAAENPKKGDTKTKGQGEFVQPEPVQAKILEDV